MILLKQNKKRRSQRIFSFFVRNQKRDKGVKAGQMRCLWVLTSRSCYVKVDSTYIYIYIERERERERY
jgi:hypothetical protein